MENELSVCKEILNHSEKQERITWAICGHTYDKHIWKDTQQILLGPTKCKVACQVLWDPPVSGILSVLTVNCPMGEIHKITEMSDRL